MSRERQAFVRSICSPRFHISNISQGELISALQSFIEAARVLDKVKRAIFYNKLIGQQLPLDGDTIPALNFEQVHADAFHGIIGKATEAGELVERLLQMADPGVDSSSHRLNLIEELGDDDWYSQLLYSFLGITQRDAQVANERKLRKRFPEAFTSERALTRDILTEQEALRPVPI